MDTRTLAKVDSGTIDIVHTPQGVLLQFNCSCADAMPFCKGMCCGMRHMYNTHLSEAEALSGKYSVMELTTRPDEYFLAYDQNTKHCIHQTPDGLCGVHSDKPANCTNWHCSPKGVGEGIERRSGGWFMLPVLLENGSVTTIR